MDSSSEKSSSEEIVPIPMPIKRSIRTTIELPFFLVSLAMSLSGVAVNNILMYRACVHSLNNTEEHCKAFLSPTRSNETQSLEQYVQSHVTPVLTVKTVLDCIGPVVLSTFLGPWSDTYGRKPLLTISCFGIAMTGISVVVYAALDGLGPWWIVLTEIPFSVSGGYVVLLTGTYCYTNDTSAKENTSLRMTILDATFVLGSVVGSFASSYMILALGNINLLICTASLYVLAYAFNKIITVESLVGASKGGYTKILNITYAKEMVRECSKVRPNHARAQIILIALVKFIVVTTTFGTNLLEYMYLRETLQWALQEYTIYTAVSTFVTFVGGFFGVMVVQKMLRLSDLGFANVILLTKIWLYAFRIDLSTSLFLYISVIGIIFKGIFPPLILAHVAKNLPKEDVAKIFTFLCAVESISLLVAPVIFNSLYSATLATFPGAIYLLSTIFTGICIPILGVVLYFSRGSNERQL